MHKFYPAGTGWTIWKFCMMVALATLTGCCYSQSAAQRALYSSEFPQNTINYKVMPGDIMNFKSDTIREFASSIRSDGYLATVNQKGNVKLPLIGSKKVSQKTVSQIDDELNKAIRKYYTQGDIASEVKAYKSQYFIVMGEVHRPGRRAWKGNQSLLEVIVKSYPTLSSWPQRILIFRKANAGKNYSYIETPPAVANAKFINNNLKKIVINLDEMIYFRNMKNNILIMPGDVIYVQLNPLAYLGRSIQNAFTPDKPSYREQAISNN